MKFSSSSIVALCLATLVIAAPAAVAGPQAVAIAHDDATSAVVATTSTEPAQTSAVVLPADGYDAASVSLVNITGILNQLVGVVEGTVYPTEIVREVISVVVTLLNDTLDALGSLTNHEDIADSLEASLQKALNLLDNIVTTLGIENSVNEEITAYIDNVKALVTLLVTTISNVSGELKHFNLDGALRALLAGVLNILSKLVY